MINKEEYEEKIFAVKGRFRTLRQKLGLSCREMAEMLDMSTQTYGMKERTGSFNVAEFVKITMAVPRVNLDWLIKGEGEMLRTINLRENI